MNQRLIHETAFNMTRILVGMPGHEEGSDEEYRQRFERVFQTCKSGLTRYHRQVERMQHNLNPMGGTNASATAS
ncbi:MAG TPA: hypothetical protein PKD86_08470 [Gemmatales bacterium]|nr:hypothetical protein [Gemmatales bacterium]HMP59373.1 hypothetical protein [Gemmatales bacterium]